MPRFVVVRVVPVAARAAEGQREKEREKHLRAVAFKVSGDRLRGFDVLLGDSRCGALLTHKAQYETQQVVLVRGHSISSSHAGSYVIRDCDRNIGTEPGKTAADLSGSAS